MNYRPRISPLWVVLPALAAFFALGVWEVNRMQWKAAIIEETQIRSRAPAIPLPVDDRIPTVDLVYRPARVSGLYLHESEIRLLSRTRGGKSRIAVITPLVRSDGGPTLLVDRGWAPADWTGPTAEQAAARFREVEVVGIVLVPEAPGWRTPSNKPNAGEWHYMDLSAMAGSVGVLPFVDYYLYATDEAPFVPEPPAPAEGTQTGEAAASEPAPVQAKEPAASPYPTANVWQVDTSNDHLTYAAVWFSLAAVLLAGYIVYRTRFAPGMEEDAPD